MLFLTRDGFWEDVNGEVHEIGVSGQRISFNRVRGGNAPYFRDHSVEKACEGAAEFCEINARADA